MPWAYSTLRRHSVAEYASRGSEPGMLGRAGQLRRGRRGGPAFSTAHPPSFRSPEKTSPGGRRRAACRGVVATPGRQPGVGCHGVRHCDLPVRHRGAPISPSHLCDVSAQATSATRLSSCDGATAFYGGGDVIAAPVRSIGAVCAAYRADLRWALCPGFRWCSGCSSCTAERQIRPPAIWAVYQLHSASGSTISR